MLTYSSVTEKFLQLWSAWVEDPKANTFPPILRTPVYRVAVKNDPAKAVEILKKEWFTTPAIDGKEVCLSAIGSAKDRDVIEKVIIPLNFNKSPPAAASESVPPSDMHVLGAALGANSAGRDLQWKYLRENWDANVVKLGNAVVVDRFVNMTLSKFTDVAIVDEIDAFFKDKDTASFNRTLETVKDKIRGRAAYRERDTASLKEWLAANGYA